MKVDLDDGIVSDFLVEAGEILANLANQLVDLESCPGDSDLLNAIFRGFHTIKGGAGFLCFEHLVAVSHKAEDVFDVLRRGERRVDAPLMDAVLRALDVVNAMFDEIRAGSHPDPAPPDLLQELARYATAAQAAAAAAPEPAPAANAAMQSLFAEAQPAAVEAPPAAAGDEITESEFEALLDQLHGPGGAPTAVAPQPPAAGGDEITESEFEALLDQLHGPGGAPTAAAPKPPAAGADEITESEFEALLDRLHGAGGSPTARSARAAESPAAESPAAESTPAVASDPIVAAAPRPAKAAAGSPSADTTVRVETAVLDRIMNMVGELVLIRNRLNTLEGEVRHEEVSKTVSALDIVTTDLQAAAMQTRMQPIKKVFGRFPRVVRDLARSLRKEVVLEMAGEETGLDKNLVEALADPLVHLVRNSMDHGIEAPAVREAAGKPRTGILRLAAEQQGDHIDLTIADDGAGMDPDSLRAKAVEKGLMDADAAARLSDTECFELIFLPGFSTKTEISDVSGRGVGMDVVKTRIAQLNGAVSIDSRRGAGTTISIRLPLTLAIMPTLMVVLGRQIFALPLASVKEILDFDLSKATVVEGQPLIVVRGKPLPLFYLGQWLVAAHREHGGSRGHVVIVNVGTQSFALLVDHLVGREEVVIKPLGALLHGTRGFAGATITGDGRIALIVDLPGLIAAHARR
ncbi:MAG: chemotaxis protein CheA [Gammaproteobacteria bacterium]